MGGNGGSWLKEGCTPELSPDETPKEGEWVGYNKAKMLP